nr:unnamed protein product [Digitaria exilis]
MGACACNPGFERDFKRWARQQTKSTGGCPCIVGDMGRRTLTCRAHRARHERHPSSGVRRTHYAFQFHRSSSTWPVMPDAASRQANCARSLRGEASSHGKPRLGANLRAPPKPAASSRADHGRHVRAILTAHVHHPSTPIGSSSISHFARIFPAFNSAEAATPRRRARRYPRLQASFGSIRTSPRPPRQLPFGALVELRFRATSPAARLPDSLHRNPLKLTGPSSPGSITASRAPPLAVAHPSTIHLQPRDRRQSTRGEPLTVLPHFPRLLSLAFGRKTHRQEGEVNILIAEQAPPLEPETRAEQEGKHRSMT